MTQFDELFEVGFRELVHCLVRTTDARGDKEADDDMLIGCLEQLTESVLQSWLEHSRTLRLSVLERVRNPAAWDELVAFIKEYGGRSIHSAVSRTGQYPGHLALRSRQLAGANRRIRRRTAVPFHRGSG